MPELPEVRTVSSVLNKALINKAVTDIKVIYEKVVSESSLDINLLIGKKLININTIGKYILFNFGDYTLISHLRMEGKYNLKTIDAEIEKHEHLIFTFDDTLSVRYDDTRKFGRVELIKTSDLKLHKSLSKLAQEPFDLNYEDFYKRVKKKSVPIKAILLDQTIISGIGNIYADEILFDAKINPHKLGIKITKKEAEMIINSSIKILNLAILKKGTTIRSYTSSLGIYGSFQDHLKVHTKADEKCLNCGHLILKEKIRGRSSYYCSKCQK